MGPCLGLKKKTKILFSHIGSPNTVYESSKGYSNGAGGGASAGSSTCMSSAGLGASSPPRSAGKSTYLIGSPGVRSISIRIPPPPALVLPLPLRIGRTGWNRASDGKDICASCAGVTRERFSRVSDEGSFSFRFDAVLSLSFSSSAFTVEPSSFISTSPLPAAAVPEGLGDLTSVSIASPFSFFSFARAFAFAVVERTAVATFSTASFAGGLVG